MGRSVVGQLSDALCVVWMANVCLLSFIGSGIGFLLSLAWSRDVKRAPPAVEVIGTSCKDSFLSIVIVVKDDAKLIGRTIRNLEVTTANKQKTEIVLVDAGCRDNSVGVARASAGSIKVVYVRGDAGAADATEGRGVHRNRGFMHCRYNREGAASGLSHLVLFLAPDALTPPGYDESIRIALADREVRLAAFRLALDTNQLARPPPAAAAWLLEALVNLRTRCFQLPCGAQGLALRADDFAPRMFSSMIVLEDLDLADAVRRRAAASAQSVRLLRAPLRVNPQQWTGLGIFFTTLIHEMAHFSLLYLGIPIHNIYIWYYIYLANFISLFFGGGRSISPGLD